MAAGERERRELQEALVGTIGPDPTDTLLGYLPPVGWADVATKRDLDHFATQIRLEMTELKAELRTEMAPLRTEMAELRSELHVALNAQLRWMVGLVVLVILTVIGTGIFTR